MSLLQDFLETLLQCWEVWRLCFYVAKRGVYNIQCFPNLFDNGTSFSKPSNALLDTIDLMFSLFKFVKCCLRDFGQRQMQRQSIKRSSEVSSIKQLTCYHAPETHVRQRNPQVLRMWEARQIAKGGAA